MIKMIGDLGPRRLIVRRIDEQRFAESVSNEAATSNKWIFDVIHGGGVSSAYNYPAETECALAVASPSGVTVCWVGRITARSVTYRGVAESLVRGSGDIWDGRVKKESRINASREILKEKFNELVPPLLQLGTVA